MCLYLIYDFMKKNDSPRTKVRVWIRKLLNLFINFKLYVPLYGTQDEKPCVEKLFCLLLCYTLGRLRNNLNR